MKISFNAVLAGLFSIILTGIIGIGFMAHQNNQALFAASKQIESTDEILEEAESITSLDDQNESAMRNYILSRDSTLIQNVAASRKVQFAHIAKLDALITDTSVLQSKLDSLTVQVTQKNSFFDNAVAMGNVQGIAAVAHFVSTKEAAAQIAIVGQLLSEIELTEAALLKQHQQINERNIFNLNRIFLLSIIPFLLIIISLIIIVRYLSLRKTKEDATTLLNAILEDRVIERTQELHQSESNMKAILENTDTGYVLLNNSFQVLSFNHMAEIFVQKDLLRSLAINTDFIEYFPPDKRESRMKMVQKVLQGEDFFYESSYLQPDGSVIWYDIQMFNVQDKQHASLGLTMAITNITQRKLAEIEIRSLNESLEKRVTERTSELEQTNKELESFSYTVSHDLRAPLRVINGYGNILMKREKDKLGTDSIQFLQDIMSSATRMGQLVDDLLNLSKTGKSLLTKRPVNMNEDVKAIVEDVKKSLNGSFRAKIVVHELQSVACDAGLLRQVWTNLISNAAKYSCKKEAPVIEIGSEETNGSVVYYVKDNGAGFDMAYADKLFGVFQRLHKVSEFEGTGVGLALVHKIVTRHGGSVWAKAKEGEGATFYFTLS